jgi:hypothetical protein
MEGTRRATARAVKVKEYSIGRGCVNVKAGTPFSQAMIAPQILLTEP